MRSCLLLSLILYLCLFTNGLVGEPAALEENDHRYIVKIIKSRAISNTPIPAIVLDTVRGVVWICQNIQLEQPTWVKADLGQNKKKYLTRSKYTLKMLERQEGNLRIPAIVIDTKEGIAWTCPNITESKISWIKKDLQSGAMKKIQAEEIGILKFKDNNLPLEE